MLQMSRRNLVEEQILQPVQIETTDRPRAQKPGQRPGQRLSAGQQKWATIRTAGYEVGEDSRVRQLIRSTKITSGEL